MTKEQLMEQAVRAMETAYAPYSGIRVGAALLTKSAAVYTGCNVENASYGATVCAERTAVFSAVAKGEREYESIAVASSLAEFPYPCGICLQVLYEFAPELTVLLRNGKKEIRAYALRELLPHAFEV